MVVTEQFESTAENQAGGGNLNPWDALRESGAAIEAPAEKSPDQLKADGLRRQGRFLELMSDYSGLKAANPDKYKGVQGELAFIADAVRVIAKEDPTSVVDVVFAAYDQNANVGRTVQTHDSYRRPIDKSLNDSVGLDEKATPKLFNVVDALSGVHFYEENSANRLQDRDIDTGVMYVRPDNYPQEFNGGNVVQLAQAEAQAMFGEQQDDNVNVSVVGQQGDLLVNSNTGNTGVYQMGIIRVAGKDAPTDIVPGNIVTTKSGRVPTPKGWADLQ